MNAKSLFPLLGLTLGTAVVLAAQPVNDSFADRIALSGPRVTTTGSNVSATREPGEPGGGGSFNRGELTRTVWWSWTAPGDGVLAVSMMGSDFRAVGDVHTGADLAGLHSVSDCPENGPWCETARVPVSAGTAYHIVVGTDGGPGGNILLNLAFIGRPPNDNFANRVHLSSDPASASGSNTAASQEVGEIPPPFQQVARSIWWSWTAPVSGPVTMGVEASPFTPDDYLFTDGAGLSTALGVFTGNSLNALTLVTNRSDYPWIGTSPLSQVTFAAVAGTTYQVAVDGTLGFFGTLTLDIARTRPPLVILTSPPNEAEFIAGDPVAIAAEAFDPEGAVSAVEFGVFSEFGSDVRRLRVSARPFRVAWTNLAPGQYYLTARVTDDLGARADAIPVRFSVRPGNDDFARRIPFTGSFVTVTGVLANASSEPGEPADLGQPGIWWAWTAPASGTFTITAVADYYPTLAVFTGESLNDLTLVASGVGRVVITAEAGRVYPIAVGGEGNQCTLNVAQTVPPTVTVTSPTNGATFLVGDTVTFTVTAADADGTVRRLELFLDGYVLLGVTTNNSFTVALTFTNGNVRHCVHARAMDDAGITTATTNAVCFEVNYPGPLNDNFADRIAFTGSFISVTGSTAYATYEPSEPQVLNRGSVWWAWTAPVSGPFTITASSPIGYWPSLAVFNGSNLAGLNLVTNSAFAGWNSTYSTRVVVQAQAGTTYPIAVGSGGAITLAVARTLPPTVTIASPANGAVFIAGDTINLVANATDVDGTVSRVEFYNGFTLLGTVTSSPFVLSVTTTNRGYIVSDGVQAWATDNHGVTTVSEEVRFLVRPPGPPNDYFADRIAFTGSFVTVTGTTANATFEVGETSPLRDGSAWWAWTAPESGDFTITVTSDSGYWPSMAVFTGPTLAGLNLITNNAFQGGVLIHSTHVVLRAQSGTTYPIAVGSRGAVRLSVARSLPPSVAIISPTNGVVVIAGQTVSLVADATDPDGTVSRVEFYRDGYEFLGAVSSRPFVLNLANLAEERWYSILALATDNQGLVSVSSEVRFFVQRPPPPNDDFAARIPLAGVVVATEADARRATREPNEPTSGPFPEAGSVWWSWIAPASGKATLNCSDGFSFLGVYTGTNLTSLSLIATNTAENFSAQLVFDVIAGTEYQIVSSSGSERQLLSLFLDARELRGPRMLPNGLFAFDLRTTVDRLWIIEASTNLVNWTPLAAGRCADGTLEFLDPTAADHPQRFYRAVAEPQ